MCQIVFDCKLGCGESKVGWTKAVITTLILATFTSLITIGGLASVQDQCHPDQEQYTLALADNYGFNPMLLSCKKMFRYYWFIVIFEFAILAMGLFAAVSAYKTWRYAMMGLFVVSMLLFIKSSDAWLAMSEAAFFQADTQKDRVRAAVAGWISTAALNGLLVAMFGYEYTV